MSRNARARPAREAAVPEGRPLASRLNFDDEHGSDNEIMEEVMTGNRARAGENENPNGVSIQEVQLIMHRIEEMERRRRVEAALRGAGGGDLVANGHLLPPTWYEKAKPLVTKHFNKHGVFASQEHLAKMVAKAAGASSVAAAEAKYLDFDMATRQLRKLVRTRRNEFGRKARAAARLHFGRGAMGEHSPFAANGELNDKAAELAAGGLFRKYKKGGAASGDEYGGLAFRKVLATIILKKRAPSKANTKGMVLPATLVAYAECAVKYMLKGKDLPRNDSYAGKYKKAFKAVRERASNYVKFEGAAVAADARS